MDFEGFCREVNHDFGPQNRLSQETWQDNYGGTVIIYDLINYLPLKNSSNFDPEFV